MRSSRSPTAGSELHSELALENSLHKLDTLTEALAALRAGLLAERKLYLQGEPRVAKLNRRRRRRRSTASGRTADG